MLLQAADAVITAGMVTPGIGEGRRRVERRSTRCRSRRQSPRPVRGAFPAWNECSISWHIERHVVPVKLGEPVVVADQRPARDPSIVPGAEVAAWAVMIGVGAAEEPFVITFDDLATIADHVQAVVRALTSLNRCADPAATQIPSSPARSRTPSAARSSAPQSYPVNVSKSAPA